LVNPHRVRIAKKSAALADMHELLTASETMASRTFQDRIEHGDQRCKSSISQANSIRGRRYSKANEHPSAERVLQILRPEA